MGLKAALSLGLTLWVSGCALEPLPSGAVDASRFANGAGDALPGDADPGDTSWDGGDAVEPGDETYNPVTCDDGTAERPAQFPAAGDLVINEVFANPTGADLFADWFEIWVAALQPVDLNDLTIRQTAPGEATRELTFSDPACLTAAPGAYLVIGASTDPAQTRNAPVDLSPGLLQLFNQASTLELWMGPLLVDWVQLNEPVTGASWELDPALQTADQNDKPESFCVATRDDVFDELGSPGLANAPCP